MNALDFEEFFSHVIATLLWSSTDDLGEPLDDCTVDDIDPEQLEEIEAHAKSFFLRCWHYVEYEKISKTMADLGHDYILTINGHGVGFWEKSDWPMFHDTLTRLARCYPPIESVILRED